MGMFPPTATSSIISQHLHGQRVADDFQRLQQFRAAWEAYRKQDTPPLPIEAGRPNDNVRVNLIKLIVQTSVSFLFGDQVAFSVPDAPPDDPRIQYLDRIWNAAKKMTWLYKQGINGGLCGHIFARIYPEQPLPRIVILDPATVTVRWAADDLDRVECYLIDYSAYEWQGNREVLVSIRQRIERTDTGWRILDQRSQPDKQAFDTLHEAPWPYPFPPIVDSQNLAAPNEYWGEADITPDLIALVNAGDFTLSNQQRIVRFYAQPLTVAKGMDPAQLKHGRDRTVFIPPNADLSIVEMQSELAASLDHHSRIKSSIHEVAQTPEIATGKVEDLGNLSGLALQILYGPLLQKTVQKRMLYGDFLSELNRRLLMIGGFPETTTTVVWDSMLPTDPQAERVVAQADRTLGVSEATLLTQLGYDPAHEREQRQAETPPDHDPMTSKGDADDSNPDAAAPTERR
ncbi:hypothetical protein Haur_0655 [Herpetosiphon aurantiacus DSM 785]|uniref:Phage portal protein, SPP1 Gp6-like n=1 Tax=Herpetosiphon aurantiacus (strain ATCC 23779 / DSM 785 / 114-95) TaxID=316274 RepID=A9AWQ2_HERA2|nr:hypothetical protein Haur_0655 [Herpetosiphon aurantiacus DSM 785]